MWTVIFLIGGAVEENDLSQGAGLFAIFESVSDPSSFLDFSRLTAMCSPAFSSFYGKLLVGTMPPLVITGLMFIVAVVCMHWKHLPHVGLRRSSPVPRDQSLRRVQQDRQARLEERLMKVGNVAIQAGLAVAFLSYPSATLLALRMFRPCRQIQGYDRILWADHSVICTGEEYLGFHRYVVVVLLALPIGVPLFYTAVFVYNRKALRHLRIASLGYSSRRAGLKYSRRVVAFLRKNGFLHRLPGKEELKYDKLQSETQEQFETNIVHIFKKTHTPELIKLLIKEYALHAYAYDLVECTPLPAPEDPRSCDS